MAWSSVTAATVRPRLTATELTAIETTSLADGVSDPLGTLTTQVVDEVRGYVQAGGYTLGAAGTLPSRLISCAISIVRYRIATRIPISQLHTEQRTQEYRDAQRLLERVADGRFAVEEPATADTETPSYPGPSMGSRTLTFENADQDGL